MILSRLVEAFMNVVLPTVLIAGAGYFSRTLLHIDLRALTRLSLYVLGPALIFSSLVRTEVSGTEGLGLSLFTVALMAGLILVCLLMSKMLRYDPADRNALMITTAFGNTGNFGLAMSLFAFGQAGLEIAVIMFVVHAFLMNTVAVYLASQAHLTPREALKVIFKMPMVWAAITAVAVLLIGVDIPDPIFLPIETMGNAAIPIMLLALGMQLAETKAIEEPRKVGVSILTRLLISPALAFVLVPLFGLSGLSANVAILNAAMPTAVTTVVLAVEFAAKPRFVASVVVTSTVASIVTISGLLIWLM